MASIQDLINPTEEVTRRRRKLRRQPAEPVRRRSQWTAAQKSYLAWKRVFDLAAACALLVLLGPITLLAAMLVRLTSRGPALYSQRRIGRHGSEFVIYKLRTMVHEAESLTGPRWSTPGDPRITPVGQVLRKLHIDEFPQLLNVIRGDMSLIGPRPERPEFVLQLERSLSGYTERLAVPPGITGLAQVHLPADTDLDSVRKKLTFDLYYIDNISVWLDFRIILSTIGYLLRPARALVRPFLAPSRETVEHYVTPSLRRAS